MNTEWVVKVFVSLTILRTLNGSVAVAHSVRIIVESKCKYVFVGG